MTTIQSEKTTYFSAEFQLKNPGVFYQFKVRQSDCEPCFALVKKGSKALEHIKPGDSLVMTYHYLDKTIPAEKRITRIKYVADGNNKGFKGHYLIALEIE